MVDRHKASYLANVNVSSFLSELPLPFFKVKSEKYLTLVKFILKIDMADASVKYRKKTQM